MPVPLSLDPFQHYLKNSLFLAHCAAAAYERQPDRDYRRAEELHYVKCRGIRTARAQAFVSVHEFNGRQDMVAAFRGTANVSDWITNLSAEQRRFEGYFPGKVHRGFGEAVLSLLGELYDAVRAWWKPDMQLFVTGHSKGGAEGVLAAAYMATPPGALPAHSVTTFGAPRPGDPAFKAAFLASAPPVAFRFVNDRDIVPHLPSPWMFGARYDHVGEEQLLTESGELQVGRPAWVTLKTAVAEVLATPDINAEALRVEMIEDHELLRGYIPALAAVVEKEFG